jgi:hypothetical protein
VFKTLMIVLPLVAAITAATLRHRFAIRLIAVAVTASTFLVGLAGLIAPHRLAEEKRGGQQSAEWDRGALDTRNVVYTVIPLFVSSFGGLALLALSPVRTSKRLTSEC